MKPANLEKQMVTLHRVEQAPQGWEGLPWMNSEEKQWPCMAKSHRLPHSADLLVVAAQPVPSHEHKNVNRAVR